MELPSKFRQILLSQCAPDGQSASLAHESQCVSLPPPFVMPPPHAELRALVKPIATRTLDSSSFFASFLIDAQHRLPSIENDAAFSVERRFMCRIVRVNTRSERRRFATRAL